MLFMKILIIILIIKLILWASIGDNNKFLTVFSASSNDEILVPFSSVIQDYIDGELRSF